MNHNEQVEVMQYLDKFSSVFQEMMKDLFVDYLSGSDFDSHSIVQDTEELIDLYTQGVKVDPGAVLKNQLSFMEQQMNLWQNTAKAMMGDGVDSVIDEGKGDSRFKDREWDYNPFFNYIKQAYLLNAELLQKTVASLEFSNRKISQQAQFYTRQYINLMSPSNYVMTNPEVCREILETKGDSLAKGMDNFIQDLKNSPLEAFKLNQVDINAFKLGENLAYTPGKVVFENDLIQLIQYAPQTEQVFSTPLFIIPPFINKYYVLDLDEDKSMIHWLVSQGLTVFLISWVNPDEHHADKTFDDYACDGVIQSVDVIQAITGSDKVNAAGYCVGGTLLGASQAYLLSKGDKRIHSLTFLTTLFDFEEPGEVGNYISEQMFPLLEKVTERKGFFDGRILALGFSLLRENNLFWSFFVNSYLKGKQGVPFDILYWNGDSTNIPKSIYLYYVRNMYLDNKLICKDGIQIKGTPIDISRIKTPSYVLATEKDHIVLWPSAYRSSQYLKGEVKFVLAGSGHVAGVINPVRGGKYPYWTSDELPESRQQSPQQWFSGAQKVDGSWWLDWLNWLSSRSGNKVAAPSMGSSDYPPVEDAPGRYVKVRLESTTISPGTENPTPQKADMDRQGNSTSIDRQAINEGE